MSNLNNFPEVMRQAREDLTANVSGRFSPDDWNRILETAHLKLQSEVAANPQRAEVEAWQAVMLDYYRTGYWGFVPNYKPSRDPKRKMNLGIRFILMAMLSMTFTEMALAWLGQRYTASDNVRDAYIFYGAVIVILGNFVAFLYSARNHQD